MFLCGSLGIVLPFLFLSQENSEPEQFNLNLWKNWTWWAKHSATTVWGRWKGEHCNPCCLLQEYLHFCLNIPRYIYKLCFWGVSAASFYSLRTQRANLAFELQGSCSMWSIWKVPPVRPQKAVTASGLIIPKAICLKLIISGATQVSHICPELKTDSHQEPYIIRAEDSWVREEVRDIWTYGPIDQEQAATFMEDREDRVRGLSVFKF